MSKIFDQTKTLFNVFPEAVLILDRDFRFIWKNIAATSIDFTFDQGSIKEPKTLSSQIDQVAISTPHGSRNGYIAPLDDLFILFIPGPFPQITARTHTTNNTKGALNNNLGNLVSTSDAMKETAIFVAKAASVNANILLTGETGVGKTFLARHIHSISSRNNGPFVSINCGAIPPTLLEAELFGYEKGTFTGADRAGRVGLLETGIHGTVLLDEIAELSKDLQVKLLYSIDEKKITRVGGRKSIDLDIRLIAATNKDLIKMVKEGNFREDLFYRLNVFSFNIPPLRRRREDILELAERCLQKYNLEYNVSKSFDPKVIQAFSKYDWPGNIRELQNSIERMVVMSEGELITLPDLPSYMAESDVDKTSPLHLNKDGKLQSERDILECELIREALAENKTVRKAATKLGISHATLLRKIRKLNLAGANITINKRGRRSKNA